METICSRDNCCNLSTSSICNLSPNNLEDNIYGGAGGCSLYNCCFAGNDGENGSVCIPSQFSSRAGCGGFSSLYKGGNGGSNYFCIGGSSGNLESLIGEDGKYGSGGGGSVSRSKLDIKTKLSGRGGDGIIIIEW